MLQRGVILKRNPRSTCYLLFAQLRPVLLFSTCLLANFLIVNEDNLNHDTWRFLCLLWCFLTLLEAVLVNKS